jgi:hypothetical protein
MLVQAVAHAGASRSEMLLLPAETNDAPMQRIVGGNRAMLVCHFAF